jgi:hypothetical protein
MGRKETWWKNNVSVAGIGREGGKWSFIQVIGDRKKEKKYLVKKSVNRHQFFPLYLIGVLKYMHWSY